MEAEGEKIYEEKKKKKIEMPDVFSPCLHGKIQGVWLRRGRL